MTSEVGPVYFLLVDDLEENLLSLDRQNPEPVTEPEPPRWHLPRPSDRLLDERVPRAPTTRARRIGLEVVEGVVVAMLMPHPT